MSTKTVNCTDLVRPEVPDIIEPEDIEIDSGDSEEQCFDLSENPAAESVRVDSTTLDATVTRTIHLKARRGQNALLIRGFSSGLRHLTVGWEKLSENVTILGLAMLNDQDDEDDKATEEGMVSRVNFTSGRPQITWSSPATIPPKQGYIAALNADVSSTQPEDIQLRLEYTISKKITWRPKTRFKFSGTEKLEITYESFCLNSSREAFTDCRLEFVAPPPPGYEDSDGRSIVYPAPEASTYSLPSGLETPTVISLGCVAGNTEFSYAVSPDRGSRGSVLQKIMNRFTGEMPNRRCKVHLRAKIKNAWVFPGPAELSLDRKHVGTRRDFSFVTVALDEMDRGIPKGCIQVDVGHSNKYTKHIKATALPPVASEDTVVHSTLVKCGKMAPQKVVVTEAIPTRQDEELGSVKVIRAAIRDMISGAETLVEIPTGADEVDFNLEIGKPGNKLCELEFIKG